MEANYGIGIQNRYIFLEEEEDAENDFESKTPVLGATASGKTGPSAIPNSKTSQKPSPGALSNVANVASPKDLGRQNRSRSGNQSQKVNRVDQENRTQRSPRSNNQRSFGESKPEEGELKDAGGRELRDGKDRRNGFAGRGARRGAYTGQGGARFNGKRDFNRHSGSDKTGVKATEKRDGAGAHNWGKSDEDFTAAPEDEHANREQITETTATTDGTEAEANLSEEKTEGEGEEPKSDEPQLKTLDEYKREREEKRMHTQFNIRQANEGEDKSKWKKTYVLNKKQLADEEEVEYEEIEVEEDANKRRGRQVLDIEVSFRPSEEGRDFVRRGRGGQGGRGRGGSNERRPTGEVRTPRQGGNGNGPRPSRGGRQGRSQATPKFDDLTDFPSL